MGSNEIFDKGSDDSIQDIVAVETPSPLTSSHSSDSNSSFLFGVTEFTSEEFAHQLKNRKKVSSGDEDGNEEYSKEIGSAERLIEESLKRETDQELLLDSESVSLVSSLSSLKQRLQDLPSPDENAKLSDRIAELDRRIRREKNVYQQFQGLVADRIEEKDEAEASSVADSASVPNLQLEEDSSWPTVKDARALRRSNMCSSAPETMRVKKESFDKPLLDTISRFKTPVGKNFDDRRPPKCLQPLEAPIKEIVRCNAPPLYLSDKKIAELLRRGSVSAREEFLKKSSKAPTKLAAHQKLTGVIIKNLSSGSEDDCTSPWLIQDRSSVIKLGPEAPVSRDCTFRNNRLDMKQKLISEETQIQNRDESKYCNRTRSPRRAKVVQTSLHNFDGQANEDTEVSDDLPSSRSSKLISSLQNSINQLNSVLKQSQESHSPESRPLSVPKLDIQSQDCSQSPSLASREDSTKRSLDMNALIRALSDVSIKQQGVGNCSSRPTVSSYRNALESAEPTSSANTSAANGSRRSMVSVKNAELQKAKNNYSKTLRRSRGAESCDEKITYIDNKSSKESSKSPIVVGKTNDIDVDENYKADDKEPRKNYRKNIAAEISSVFEKEENSKNTIARSLSVKKSPKCRSNNSIEVRSNSIKSKKTRNPKSPRIPTTAASLMEEKSSGLVKNDFLSFDSLQQSREKQKRINENGITGPVAVSSEPGTSRNGRVILHDHLSSRASSGPRDILPRVSKDDPGSSDDRFKYLQRGSKIPYVRSSESSSSEREETEFQLKIIKPSATGFQSAHSFPSKTNSCKFKIYEDTDEASSPRPELTFPIEELNNPTPATLADSPRSAAVSSLSTGDPSISCEEFLKSEPGSTHKNAPSGRQESNLKDSSPQIFHDCETLQRENQENPKNTEELAESGNIFWADSSGELDRAMGSSYESRTETANYAVLSGTRSCLISPTNCAMKKKAGSSSPGRSPKIFSNRSSSIGTGSSGSPKCRYDDNARHVSKNLAAGTFGNFVGDAKRKISPENFFSSSAIAKRLSYSELQAPASKEDASEEEFSPGPENFLQKQRETSPRTEELIRNAEFLNSSQMNLATSGRSDSTVHHFRKAFDRATTRAKTSSSLSKLARSPEESTNFASRRRSQDRFPFTISESPSAKSSSKLRAEHAIQATSGCVAIEPSEMAYNLRVHPSLLRLASSGFEATAEEIIESASRDSNIEFQRGGFVKTFVRRFSSRWRRSKKLENKSGSRTTKILYENKECRLGSAEESSGSAEEPRRRFDRDGLWVEGLRDETSPNSDEEKNQSPDTKGQKLIDHYSNFLARREQDKRQLGRHSFFTPKNPMNSLMIDEDSDIDPGCFCARMCQFLIGGDVHPPHRSSLFLRARRSNLRRRV